MGGSTWRWLVAEESEEGRALELDVKAVLAEIGAEEAVAQLEARIDGFEHEFERLESRMQEAERARQGELDVMRARVSDALQVVQDAVDEQRGAWEQLEERLAELAREHESHTTDVVGALREDLAPRVHRALLQVDEVQARVAGELESLEAELRARVEQAGERTGELRAATEQRFRELGAQLEELAEQRAAAIGDLEGRVSGQVQQLAEVADEQRTELTERLEALRRELDGAAGELRAGWNLRAQELEAALAETHDQLADAIDAQVASAGELERRWIEGTRDIARRIEEVAAESRRLAAGERGAREDAVRGLDARIEELRAGVADVTDRLGAEETRRATSVEQVRRSLDEVGGRLGVLSEKVGNAVGQIASELATRVASLSGEIEALRDSAVRREQRLAALDAVTERLDGLETQQASMARRLDEQPEDSRLDQLQRALASMRQDLATLAGGVEESVEQSGAVRQQLGTVQDALHQQNNLRQEVRDLTARTAELATRLEETEKVARAAGQAIAGAVRKARDAAAQAARPPTPPPPPGPESGSAVPATERAPLFQDPPSVPRRGDLPPADGPGAGG